MVGQRSTTALLSSAEFGCSEENQSCSGGYPELINSVGVFMSFHLKLKDIF